MPTPYELGYQSGHWTAKRLKDSGWDNAAKALVMAEQSHAEDTDRTWKWSDQAKATLQREFLMGCIARERETLGSLSDQGY